MARRGLLHIPMPRRAWTTLRTAGGREERAYGKYVTGAVSGGSYTRSCNYVEPWAAAAASVLTWVEPSITTKTDERVRIAARVMRWMSPGPGELHMLFTIPWLLAVVLRMPVGGAGLDEGKVRGVVRVPAHMPSGFWVPGPPRLVRRATYAELRDVVQAFNEDGLIPAECWFLPSACRDPTKRYAVASSVRRGEYVTDFKDELARADAKERAAHTIAAGGPVLISRAYERSETNAGRAQLLRESLLHVARKG